MNANEDKHVTDRTVQVTITDVKMPFLAMVLFLVKLALASIPAAILTAVLWYGALSLASTLAVLWAQPDFNKERVTNCDDLQPKINAANGAGDTELEARLRKQCERRLGD